MPCTAASSRMPCWAVSLGLPLAARASVGLVVAAAAVLQAEAQPVERLVAGTARIHPHQSTHGRIMGTLLAGVKPQGRILGRMLGSIIHRDACGRSKLSYVFQHLSCKVLEHNLMCLVRVF